MLAEGTKVASTQSEKKVVAPAVRTTKKVLAAVRMPTTAVMRWGVKDTPVMNVEAVDVAPSRTRIDSAPAPAVRRNNASKHRAGPPAVSVLAASV
jgi:hypothetical protein